MSFAVQFDDVEMKFGVSGLLYNSDVLLYDYATGSLWSQLLSTAISGPLKGYGIPAIPTAHTTWRDSQTRHPDTQVLSTDTGFRIKYRGSPYTDYKNSSRLMFPVAEHSNAYRRKELTIEWQEDEQYARALDSNGEEITTVIVYWFAWYAFHSDTEIFTA